MTASQWWWFLCLNLLPSSLSGLRWPNCACYRRRGPRGGTTQRLYGVNQPAACTDPQLFDSDFLRSDQSGNQARDADLHPGHHPKTQRDHQVDWRQPRHRVSVQDASRRRSFKRSNQLPRASLSTRRWRCAGLWDSTGSGWGARRRPAGGRSSQVPVQRWILVPIGEPPPWLPPVRGLVPPLVGHHGETLWRHAAQGVLPAKALQRKAPWGTRVCLGCDADFSSTRYAQGLTCNSSFNHKVEWNILPPGVNPAASLNSNFVQARSNYFALRSGGLCQY